VRRRSVTVSRVHDKIKRDWHWQPALPRAWVFQSSGDGKTWVQPAQEQARYFRMKRNSDGLTVTVDLK
jgi:hypothetical protein